jgi:hypothetical protein
MGATTYPTLSGLLAHLEAECATPEVWESLRSAGQQAEDGMIAKARETKVFETYDTTMTARVGAAQDVESSAWMTGYLFEITHFYGVTDETTPADDSVRFFLAFNADGKINEVVPEEEFHYFKPVHATN